MVRSNRKSVVLQRDRDVVNSEFGRCVDEGFDFGSKFLRSIGTFGKCEDFAFNAINFDLELIVGRVNDRTWFHIDAGDGGLRGSLCDVDFVRRIVSDGAIGAGQEFDPLMTGRTGDTKQ